MIVSGKSIFLYDLHPEILCVFVEFSPIADWILKLEILSRGATTVTVAVSVTGCRCGRQIQRVAVLSSQFTANFLCPILTTT